MRRGEKKMPTAKLIPAAKKTILSVTLKRVLDENPDTSWLGEYSNKRTSDYSIDRRHSEDCDSQRELTANARQTIEHARGTVAEFQALEPNSDTLEWQALEDAYYFLDSLADEVIECDCGGHQVSSRELPYFNPSFNYVDASGNLREGMTAAEVRKYVRQDYDRMESLNNGSWSFIGIVAECEIEAIVDGKPYTTELHASVWGIESDSDRDYLKSTEDEQLADIRSQLGEYGFSSRAISQAFKFIERKEE
jgi:hypothetical protein